MPPSTQGVIVMESSGVMTIAKIRPNGEGTKSEIYLMLCLLVSTSASTSSAAMTFRALVRRRSNSAGEYVRSCCSPLYCVRTCGTVCGRSVEVWSDESLSDSPLQLLGPCSVLLLFDPHTKHRLKATSRQGPR